MKLILDLQVQKLAKEKEAVKKQSMELGVRISHDVETYEQEQKRKKLEQIQKYQKHQKDVQDQIDQRSKLLQFIGSSLVKPPKQE